MQPAGMPHPNSSKANPHRSQMVGQPTTTTTAAASQTGCPGIPAGSGNSTRASAQGHDLAARSADRDGTGGPAATVGCRGVFP